MNISVVIPTYNRKRSLKSCLNSLFNQTYSRDKYEIIVVDDGSTDGTRELIKDLKKKNNFHYFYQKNQGPAAARNLGIKYAKGKVIAFTDDDCVVDQDWLRSLVEKLVRNKKIVGVGGKILAWKPKNLIEKYAEVFLFSKGNTIKGKFQPPFLITANCAYYAKTIKKIGLFDSSLRRFVEDLDLGWRLNFLGYQFAYASSAIVYHRMPQTLKSLLAKYFLYGRNKTAAVHKHQNRLENKYYCSIKIKDFIIDDFIKWPFSLIKWPKRLATDYKELPSQYKEKKYFQNPICL